MKPTTRNRRCRTQGREYADRLGVEHLHNHLHNVARGEELALGAFQRGTDDGFVGDTFDIHGRVEEIVFLQLGDDESDNIGIKQDAWRGVGEQRAKLFAL